MARSRWTDYLNDHLFWAMDVSSARTIPVFTPLFGFSGITAPRMQIEMETFNDGTYIYPRNVVKRATVGEITFTRAASLYDSDFYDWTYHAIYGTTASKDIDSNRFTSALANASGGVRRNLLLFHFARINLDPSKQVHNQQIRDHRTQSDGSILGGIASAAEGLASSVVSSIRGLVPIGPFTHAAWLPARAWLLHDCLPVSYSSGSDFDANSGAISLMNLTVVPEYIEEYSMGLKP